MKCWKMEFHMKKQFAIAFIIYLGPMMVGFGLGWSSPMVPKLQHPEETPFPEPLEPGSGQGSLIGSIIFIGSIIGPYVGSYLSNEKGRKPCLIVAGIVTTLSLIILAIATNMAMILTGRILSTPIRGMLLTGPGIFSTTGTLLVYSVGPFTPYAVTNYIGAIISAVYVIGLFFVPETPTFYVMKGRDEEAKRVLIKVGRSKDFDLVVQSERKQKSKEDGSNWKELFMTRNNRKAFIITSALTLLQQLSGVMVLTFFATSIFELAGSSLEPELSSIVLGSFQIVSCFIAPVCVERAGRKILLLSSTGICGISLALLGTYFFLDHQELSVVESLRWLPLTALIAFFMSYDAGFNLIPGAYLGEMYTANVRSLGSTIVMTTAWLVGFSISLIFEFMIEYLGGYGTFWFYSVSCIIAFVFTAVYVPETKGKTFVEIQTMLSK
ncbi:sugar transporter domain-containing protein [Phthorimaea operculella]|nr:sugar transporter domain-containing protein [Phthorimaea operculella]